MELIYATQYYLCLKTTTRRRTFDNVYIYHLLHMSPTFLASPYSKKEISWHILHTFHRKIDGTSTIFLFI